MSHESPYLIPSLTLTLSGEYETGRLAALLARISVSGDLIRLQGELGAGKSTFCRHYLQALGHKGEVPSPTYTLVQTYGDTRFPVAHVDCYRMREAAEMDGLGLEDYRKYGIILCEWPEKGSDLVADGQPDFLDYHINSLENPGTLSLRFEAGPSQYSRTITLEGSGSWQYRFALLSKLGFELPVVVTRPVDDQGRKAFLDTLGLKDYALDALGGDWSGRSYWRVKTNGKTLMLMDAPPPQEGVTDYANVAEYYRGIGLRSAQIVAANHTEGYLLSEDFGDTQLWNLVKDGADQRDWYKAVADGLIKQCQSAPPAWGRLYSAKDWWVEVLRFANWFMPFAHGKATALEEYRRWQDLWTPLHARVMRMPTGLMMWDCQSPNLMILGDEPKLDNIGWIDIQDARVAPVCQDLGHLLRNIRSPQNDDREAFVLDHVADQLKLDRAELQTCIDICSLHNACRIIGGLTRIYVRDGKYEGPVKYLERTWETARQSYANPALREIVDFMQDFEAPGLARLWKETAGKAA